MRYLILVLLLRVSLLFSQNYNTELLSNVRFDDDCANIWGYADGNGKEYAIVGRETGTSIFDVTDGRNPKLLKHIAGARGIWREIKSYKERLYVVADQGQDGLLIINMSKAPEDISFIFYRPLVMIDDKNLNITRADFLNRAHTLFIDEKGYCYLAGGNLHFGLVMFDLNKNPDSPEFVGLFNPKYVHDAFARNDTLWSADLFAGEFSVWDLKDKKDPKILASQRTSFAFTHNIWLSDDGRYAFTTDERANAFVDAYDVSDLNNITLVDRYRSKTTQIRGTIPHNTYYHNSYLVTSYYTDGFTIVDASDPSHLVEVGAYDTYPAGEEDFHGCWGVYPYLPSGNILASDIEFGLFVVKPTYKKASYLKGIIKDSLTGLPIADVKIKIGITPFTEVFSTSDGSYKTGGPYTGVVPIEIVRNGYLSKKVTVNLQTGQVTTTEILLQPLKNGEIKLTIIDAISKKGIPDVQIFFERPESNFFANTDGDGNSLNFINEGIWNVRLGAWGYKLGSQTVLVTETHQTLTIELSRRYEDNFIFNLGWSANSTAIRGIWGRVEPRGAYILAKAINPDFDLPEDIGDRCMITGNGSTEATGDDVDGGYTRLVSPAMNLTSFKQPVLSFYAWTVRMNVFDTIPAVGSHRVYIVSGLDTFLIDSLTPNNPSWKKYTYTLGPNKLKNLSNVHIIFEASEPASIDTRNIIEFGLDGFLLTDGPVTAIKTETTSINKLKVFPSPFIDQVTLSTTAQPFDQRVELIDMYGRIVHSYTWYRLTPELMIRPEVPSGLYFIRVRRGNESGFVYKVIKG